ncbi:MAG: hypothetical protein N2322_05000, partial [Terrimicrobiaceae bacterium]|nr:hypothetical protein [Terrimicrobiaceae bacterium]
MRKLLPALALLATAALLPAQLANVWHIPGNTENGIPSTMRSPLNPTAGASTTFYHGMWKGGGSNQTGGWFIYRINGGAWQSTTLAFHSDVNPGTSSHNQ